MFQTASLTHGKIPFLSPRDKDCAIWQVEAGVLLRRVLALFGVLNWYPFQTLGPKESTTNATNATVYSEKRFPNEIRSVAMNIKQLFDFPYCLPVITDFPPAG